MSTASNNNDYLLSQEYQARNQRAAQQYRLAQKPGGQASRNPINALKTIAPPTLISWKRPALGALAIIVLIALAAIGPQVALANEFDEGKVEPGNAANVNYSVAHIYYMQGDYDRAVEYLTRTVELMPLALIELDLACANPYLTLGDVYLELGQYENAVAIYQDYIDVLGGGGDPAIVTFVAQFQADFTVT